MNWKRERPGLYRSGPYVVERMDHAGGFWHANGPGIPSVSHDTKEDAQTAAEKIAYDRAANADVLPVPGDTVTVTPNQRGRVKAVITCNAAKDGRIYSIQFPRGSRICLYRHEFSVVVP